MNQAPNTNTGDEHEFRKFANEFKSESDRAAVILGAAKLDILLYQCLDRFLIPCPTGKDELLEGDSPLATFSSRINMVFRLGLISNEFARSLHLVRRIRNSFAHELSGVSLTSGAHKDRIRELVMPIQQTSAFKHILKEYYDEKSDPASLFRATVGLMALRLEGLFEALQTIEPPVIYSLKIEWSPGERKEVKKDA